MSDDRRGDSLKIINLQTVLYIVGLCIIIIGICIGIDAGNSMVVIDSEVQYIFDWFKAFVIGGISAASGLLFFAIARIIDLLEEIARK